jgi:hypothetical protein
VEERRLGKKLVQEGYGLAERVNFIVKAKSVKAKDIRKALEEAGIEVRSVTEVFREEEGEEEEVAPHGA